MKPTVQTVTYDGAVVAEKGRYMPLAKGLAVDSDFERDSIPVWRLDGRVDDSTDRRLNRRTYKNIADDPGAADRLWSLTVAADANDENQTPDALAEQMADLIREHRRAVDEADEALIEALGRLHTAHSVRYLDRKARGDRLAAGE